MRDLSSRLCWCEYSSSKRNTCLVWVWRRFVLRLTLYSKDCKLVWTLAFPPPKRCFFAICSTWGMNPFGAASSHTVCSGYIPGRHKQRPHPAHHCPAYELSMYYTAIYMQSTVLYMGNWWICVYTGSMQIPILMECWPMRGERALWGGRRWEMMMMCRAVFLFGVFYFVCSSKLAKCLCAGLILFDALVKCIWSYLRGCEQRAT